MKCGCITRGVQLVHPSETRESLKGPVTLSIDRVNERGDQLVHPSGTRESLKGPITLSIDRANERGVQLVHPSGTRESLKGLITLPGRMYQLIPPLIVPVYG
jgi:hypothetical protein